MTTLVFGHDIKAATAMRKRHRRAMPFTVIDEQIENLAEYVV